MTFPSGVFYVRKVSLYAYWGAAFTSNYSKDAQINTSVTVVCTDNNDVYVSRDGFKVLGTRQRKTTDVLR